MFFVIVYFNHEPLGMRVYTIVQSNVKHYHHHHHHHRVTQFVVGYLFVLNLGLYTCLLEHFVSIRC